MYKHLATVNDSMAGNQSQHFENRLDSATANISDLIVLFDKLAEHYATGPGRLNNLDVEVLINLFSSLSEYYALGIGAQMEGALELNKIYDIMAQAFGKESDFVLNDEQVVQMYDRIQNGQALDAEFEGKIVQSFQELLDI